MTDSNGNGETHGKNGVPELEAVQTLTAVQQCRARIDQELAGVLAEARQGQDTKFSEGLLAKWIDLLAELSDKDGEARGRREMLASLETRLKEARGGNA